MIRMNGNVVRRTCGTGESHPSADGSTRAASRLGVDDCVQVCLARVKFLATQCRGLSEPTRMMILSEVEAQGTQHTDRKQSDDERQSAATDTRADWPEPVSSTSAHASTTERLERSATTLDAIHVAYAALGDLADTVEPTDHAPIDGGRLAQIPGARR